MKRAKIILAIANSVVITAGLTAIGFIIYNSHHIAMLMK